MVSIFKDRHFFMTNRLDLLQQFLEEDPHDPFNIYALALEFQKIDVYKSKELFDQLLKDHENYIPSYYHAGNLYLTLNLIQDAKMILEKGILKARQQNELKAMREMQSIYDELAC
jgi:tetratricopeptide (TPR) repeat protein